MLHKMKIKPNNLCEHCQDIDYLEHFFFQCKRLNGFWNYISLQALVDINIKYTFSIKDVLFGIQNNSCKDLDKTKLKYLNYLILVGKMCISKFRYGKINNIRLIFELEWNLRAKNMSLLA